MNVGAALTRKIGPLPAWGWGVAVGGALLGVKMLRGGSLGGGGGTDKQVVVTVPTGTPAGGGDSGEFVSQLAEQLAQVRDQIADTDEATRSDWDARFSELVEDFGDRFDDLADMVNTSTPPVTNTPQPSGSINLTPPAIYDSSTGAWKILDWARVTPETLADIAWAHSVGRGPSTGAERDPTIDKIKSLIASGVSKQQAYNQVATELAPLRTVAA